MLLTITSTQAPATDLGYLQHKNPARLQTVELTFGRAHVFYPGATAERCTAALLLEVDPVRLSRRTRGDRRDDAQLEPYVNDRPYVASSFLSVAIAEAFGTALAGRSRERPDLVEQALPLASTLAAVPCREGEGFLRRLFEPLGYAVAVTTHPLDPARTDWGDSRVHDVAIAGRVRLRDLLAHLYVLVPVLDEAKHYFVGDDEVEKLLRRGEGWLESHPERELIARRYLVNRRGLVRDALARLADKEDDAADPDESAAAQADAEAAIERRLSLAEERVRAVTAVLAAAGAERVLDLGCGEGRLLRALARERGFTELAGVDVSHRALERAAEALRRDPLAERQRERVKLLHGSLVYRDRRLEGYDAAAALEVIEHLDPPRLGAFERVVFEKARPPLVVLTTPNAEWNARLPGLAPGELRHADHRFEWTRSELEAWARGVASRHGYDVGFEPVGPLDAALGAPTQMAVFRRTEGAVGAAS